MAPRKITGWPPLPNSRPLGTLRGSADSGSVARRLRRDNSGHGAALGATSGRIFGALLKAGISEEDAHVYAESVRRGEALVTARVDDARGDAANAVLQNAKGVDISARRQEYATEGWKQFDETSEPYAPAAVPPVGLGRI